MPFPATAMSGGGSGALYAGAPAAAPYPTSAGYAGAPAATYGQAGPYASAAAYPAGAYGAPGAPPVHYAAQSGYPAMAAKPVLANMGRNALGMALGAAPPAAYAAQPVRACTRARS